jgi:hypothetical protein
MENLPTMLKELKKIIPAGFTNPGGMANIFKNIMLAGKIIMIFFIFIMILQSISSAKLSYSYNLSIGNSHFLALLYAILCFVFPYFYFPYYAFFLFSAATSSSGSNRNTGMAGGAWRRR